MAVQIYYKAFYSDRINTVYDNLQVAREQALERVNNFFFAHYGYDVVNIIEDYSNNHDTVILKVFYKTYM